MAKWTVNKNSIFPEIENGRGHIWQCIINYYWEAQSWSLSWSSNPQSTAQGWMLLVSPPIHKAASHPPPGIYQLFSLLWASFPTKQTNMLLSLFASLWAAFLPAYCWSPSWHNQHQLHHCRKAYFKTISHTFGVISPIILHYYWCGVNKTQPDEWFGEWLSHLHSLIMLQTRGHLGVGGMLCCIWEAYTTLKATLPVNPMTLPHSECHTCSISQGNEFTQTRGSWTKKDELRSKGGVKRIFLLWHLLTDRCSSWERFWSTAIFQVPT